MTKGNPDFDIDLRWGQYGEDTVAAMLGTVGHRIEVKSPRNSRLTFYIETRCDKGRKNDYQPSGIRTSRAETWVYNFMDEGSVRPMSGATTRDTPACFFVMRRRDVLDYIESGRGRYAEFKEGNCPTKGYWIDLQRFLSWLVGGKPPLTP